jgi:hypothetical protein
MNNFQKCTIYREDKKTGRHHVDCIFGFWAVDCPVKDDAFSMAGHYWQQYHADGEYDELIARTSKTEEDKNWLEHMERYRIKQNDNFWDQVNKTMDMPGITLTPPQE